MGERWDNFREEMYYPVSVARDWWENEDNVTATRLIAGITAVIALLVYGGLFFGGKAIVRALSDDATITVVGGNVDGNPCLTQKGLVKTYAPAACYEDKNPHPMVIPPHAGSTSKPATPTAETTYNPPCGPKSDAHSCADQIYAKRLLEGEIGVVTFHSDEKTVVDGHLQPDYTEVQFYALHEDEEVPNEKFCGNVLGKFTPGKKFKMVINESKQSDYNGCYVIDVVTFTFDGDPYYQHKPGVTYAPSGVLTPEDRKRIFKSDPNAGGPS
jgi:hypothetical protein